MKIPPSVKDALKCPPDEWKGWFDEMSNDQVRDVATSVERVAIYAAAFAEYMRRRLRIGGDHPTAARRANFIATTLSFCLGNDPPDPCGQPFVKE